MAPAAILAVVLALLLAPSTSARVFNAGAFVTVRHNDNETISEGVYAGAQLPSGGDDNEAIPSGALVPYIGSGSNSGAQHLPASGDGNEAILSGALVLNIGSGSNSGAQLLPAGGDDNEAIPSGALVPDIVNGSNSGAQLLPAGGDGKISAAIIPDGGKGKYSFSNVVFSQPSSGVSNGGSKGDLDDEAAVADHTSEMAQTTDWWSAKVAASVVAAMALVALVVWLCRRRQAARKTAVAT